MILKQMKYTKPTISFTDDYTGERYKAISDEMYTEKVYGYIEK